MERAVRTVDISLTVRELRRQVGALLFERASLSRNKNKVVEIARHGAESMTPAQAMRDPYVLLCTGKCHALMEYALAGLDNQLFVSRYQLELPGKAELEQFLREQVKESMSERRSDC